MADDELPGERNDCDDYETVGHCYDVRYEYFCKEL